MAVDFTPEQQKVIDLRKRNILVSAAAGSGKTAVLVERIITMLTKDENPIDIDELLIVTYTEAAAAEMKERIQNAIEKALEEDSDNVHLQRQATLIHQARITTIHGFCLSVIRDYFHTIDLDPGFRVAEDGELKLIKQDVAEALIETYYEEGKEQFLSFVESYAPGKDDRKLEEILLQLYGFSRSYPNPDAWLDACVKQYDVESVSDLEACPFIQDILTEIKCHLGEWLEELEYAITVCDSEYGPVSYREMLVSDMTMLANLEKKASFVEMQEAFSNLDWMALSRKRDKDVDEEKKELVKQIRNNLKEAVGKIQKQYFFETADSIVDDLKLAKENMEMLTELVKAFAKDFREKKQSKNLVDFEDMERYALEILTREENGEFIPSSAAEELQEKFAEVMIDEYQDSNLIQEAILTSVSKVNKGIYNVFMVGDVKQSIYRFRLSRPELFMEKFHNYSLDDSEKQRIDLHLNFRSRREVLEPTNFIFEQIMTGKFGGITYDEKAALNVGAPYDPMPGNETEVLILDADDAEKEERVEAEASMIAKRIKELVGHHKIFDKKLDAYRPARYSDIVILTRSLVGWTDVFAEVLGEQGIPTYTSSREGYFQTREIKLVLDYLRILDNPRQDIPFVAVLLSMFGTLTNEELAIIKSSTDARTMYERVCDYMENGKRERLRQKLERFMETFQSFRKRVPYTAIHVLLWQILDETGYGDYVSALPGGVQRAANLEMLLSKAMAFETTSYKGLFNFVRYMEQLHKYNVDYGEANLQDENMDVVNLMSIHKSKGLEFPIVFVAGISKLFNTQDIKGSIVIHPELGVGIDAIDLSLRTKTPTLLKKVIQKNISLENTAEELRVLYVAMTRAKEKLILTGSVKSLEKLLPKYGKLSRRKERTLPYGDLTKASCYLDWIMPALYRNQCFAPVLENYQLTVPFTNPLFKCDVPVVVKDMGLWDLDIFTIGDLEKEKIAKHILERWDTEEVYHEGMKEQIEEQFAYQYPYKSEQIVKQKLSVSELKKRAYEETSPEDLFHEEEVIPLLPKFLQEKVEYTGAYRGTAYHRVLELLDFADTYTAERLQNAIDAFVEKGLMDEEMASCICFNDILKFLESPIGKRLQKATVNKQFHAEQPFVLGLDAGEVYGEKISDEVVLVQGIIDVYFEEDGELVVLDYKTDKVFRAQELVDKYRAQLDYYGKALERLTGKSVKEKIIYSFALQKEIEV